MVASLPVAAFGFPRIGPHRELKFALESYWSGATDAAALAKTAAGLRASAWARQADAGADIVSCNDFSFYDHMLDTSAMVGAVPERYGWTGGAVSPEVYFAMARGGAVPAEEMTKWFDTNYHYLVPEFVRGQCFDLASDKAVTEFAEARAQGHAPRPVLVGPVTFLKLGKADGFDPLTLLPGILPVYASVLRRLAAAGADWVQIDEPVLALDLSDADRSALQQAYGWLAKEVPSLKIMLASYFGTLGDNLNCAVSLPTAGLHLDLVRASGDFGSVLDTAPADKVLSLGVINGRNIWRADLSAILFLYEPVVERLGCGRFQLAPSCSLLHVPVDLTAETELDADVRSWLAFAVQKLDELNTLSVALSRGREAVADKLAESDAAKRAREGSVRVHNPSVAQRLKSVTPEMAARHSAYAVRSAQQHAALKLPPFPTTTIGSFPQTPEVRKARADHGKGVIDDKAYETFLRGEIARVVRWQENVGLDVLVHGEPERNDMVQYFGEKLSGYAFTRHGWVQSYGSRCVRPPVIFGDVTRDAPMTVDWAVYAQSLTDKPVKGMLTGPVTMLQWSFVRDDLPRAAVCRQIALALRDEVCDLEAAGIGVIQIDEPAMREGLPLRRRDWPRYLDWAAESFRLAAGGVCDKTQIHTHMCYGEFGDIIAAIAALDADVISVEAARSQMELLVAFTDFKYPNEIGPGVYDIHSPRVPSAQEMTALLKKALGCLPAERLWVNPDCGLKTRRWAEVEPALENMVAAARALRKAL